MTTPALTYANHMAMALSSTAFAAACGYPDLDDWQRELLDDDRDTIALCSRQSGKSLALALKSLKHALFTPASTALLVSAGQRQAAEILTHATEMYRRIGRPIVSTSENVSQIVLEGGSRIISLPSMPSTVRGYSPSLICIDEASQVPDAMWEALRPMQSVTGAQMILASTPFGRRGFLYHEWTESGPKRWRKVKVTADQCSRIDQLWLAEEMASGAAWYVRQEFFCDFRDFEEQIFSTATIDLIFAASTAVEPFDFERSTPVNQVLSVDLGAAADYTAAALIEQYHVIAPGDPRPAANRFDDERLPPAADGSHWRGYTDIRVVDHWAVRALFRWPLNTSYVDVVEEIVRLMADPEIRNTTQLVVDYAGPGRPVLDMFTEAYLNDRLGPWKPWGCTLSGGFKVAGSGGSSLHKGDCIAKLLRASQRGRLHVPEDIPLADTFRRELANFSIKQSKAGNVRFEARGRTHDDILMSVAVGISCPQSHTPPRCLDAQHEAPFERPGDYVEPADYVYGW